MPSPPDYTEVWDPYLAAQVTRAAAQVQDSNFYYNNNAFLSDKTDTARESCRTFRVAMLKLVLKKARLALLWPQMGPIQKLLLISSEQKWEPEALYLVDSLALMSLLIIQRLNEESDGDTFSKIKALTDDYACYIDFAFHALGFQSLSTSDSTADFLYLASAPKSIVKSINEETRFRASAHFLVKLREIVDALCNPVLAINTPDGSAVFHILELALLYTKSCGDWQVFSVVMASQVPALERRLEQLTSLMSTERENLEKVLTLTLIPISSRFPRIALNIAFVRTSPVLQLPPWYLQSDCVSKAFDVLLRVLDNGVSIDYLESVEATRSVRIAVCQLKQCSDSKVSAYSHFNPCASKLSLTTTLMYLAFILSQNLLSKCKSTTTLPRPISQKMKILDNPPLAKPNYLFPNAADVDLGMQVYAKSYNTDLLLDSIADILYFAKPFVTSEFQTLYWINQASTPSLRRKLQFSFAELVFAGLVTSLLLAESTDKRPAVSGAILEPAYDIIDALLRHDLQYDHQKEPYMLWVCLLNFANDVCYSDLRFVETFTRMFDALKKRNESCTESLLVASGLSLFDQTFRYSELLETRPVLVADFGYLYDVRDSKGLRNSSVRESAKSADQDSSKTRQTVQEGGGSAGRQQSVHVDQFER